MNRIISELFKNQKYAAFYTNINDPSKFIFGSVLAFNDREIAFFCISPKGDADGIVVKFISDIFRIETDSIYCKHMLKLISSTIAPTITLSHTDSIFTDILHKAKDNQKVVAIELLTSGLDDIIGFISTLDDTICCISQLDSYGFFDGFSYINISDITQISYDTSDEQIIHKLWHINN